MSKILIDFSPIRQDLPISISVKGVCNIVSINGEDFDFSLLPINSYLPVSAIASNWFCKDVERQGDGTLLISLLLPHGVDAPIETKFPVPILIESDQDVALPLFGGVLS